MSSFNLITTSYTIVRRGLMQIRMAGNTPYEATLSMGVRKDWPILAGILEKGIAAISKSDRESIYNYWVKAPQPPIIGLTAHVQRQEVERMQVAGMNDHVGKPIDPRSLFKILSRYLPLATTPMVIRNEVSSSVLVLPGIDVEECLERLGGDEPLFRELLAYFSSNYSQVAQTIRDLLAAGSRTDAIRLAHSVKGAAGNLSIAGVQQAAARVELGLSSGEGNETEMLEALHKAIQSACEVINAGLSGLLPEENGEKE